MSPYTLRWGIIATGKISGQFARDLLVDPSSREVSDVSHQITAVGSRSVESAQKFIDGLKNPAEGDSWGWGAKNGKLDRVKAHGSYDGVYNDPNVDAIYVGTPHNLHYKNTKDALLAGKHVLCEKPFTIDIEELEDLVAIAREKKLFLMEAVWTRFHPIAYAVEEVLKSGKLGKPKRFAADFSMEYDLDSKPDSNRFVDPALGGGSLLDMGPYPSVWAMLLVHRNPHNKDQNPKVVSSYQSIYKRSGVDLDSRWIVEWEGLCRGQLVTDLTSPGLRENTAALQCEEGDLIIEYPPQKPETFHIIPRPDRYLASVKEKTTHHHPVHAGNHGMSYEADEVARCIRDGKTESERMPLEESKVVQRWFDSVRKNGNSSTKEMKGTAGQ
ncbi:hypothetical protein I302_100996 [Kwoniella bestiolae CBS 10118]|uniref:D-xylose 1-dehydrogenase (NADP(+), D-xylono-1,5-lactone-forming) n=1 Tax=Kwoniella bestiolae CBS 10118 TaxID=1296100 RepID=A0A1B9G6M5_9TREE|nr:hypothetical protein I302_04373 [Kwoniella bestiolae CBS 10118]OCF26686.1 hypothetical protein I302_04373 [Kwoniella bestiolae CBS 10118]